ncbi:MAG TPA: VOC family protein [Caldisericia bacterium]|nr:VOC family protein [Caldisericia bacterium]NMD14168.1 VOC family protein [Caldisericales bacterium]MBP6928464.1 VOC family protein [Caldisericia bacterium]HOR46449.1 VOC family protein [Caldisericia bacterium]HOU08180.1 VOC family protein [Caldisericia bacterium]
MEENFLGEFELSLKVNDLVRSMDFYHKLGFERVDGEPAKGWAVLRCGDLRLGLYQGHLETNLMSFLGGNVKSIAQDLKSKKIEMFSDATQEKDGSMGAKLVDPDGNIIYFNSFTDE